MKKYTLEEAVNIYGNEKQKEAIVKNKGNLKPNQFNALIKTIEQHYEKVEVEGRGKKRIILCDGKYDQIQERKTNYANCGRHNELPYKKFLSMMILHYIRKHKPQEQFSLNQWLVNIGAVDARLIAANSSNIASNKDIKMADFKQLVEKKVLTSENFDMLEHYTTYEVNYLKQGLRSAFNELKRERIIHHTVGRTGYYVESEIIDGKQVDVPKFRQLTEREVYLLGEIERRLQTKHRLNPSQIYFRPDDERVKAYKEELASELLHNFGVEYTFESHGAYIRTSDEKVAKYLKGKFHKEFKKIYQQYSLAMAQRRQNNFERKKIYSPFDSVAHFKELGMYVQIWEELQEYYGIKINE